MFNKVYLVLIIATATLASINLNAQIRIGGDVTPNSSAVLDLNPDDNTSAGNATLGLALPRVSLRNCNDAFPLTSHVKGMTVYNPASTDDVKPGIYINNGVKWLRLSESEIDFSVLGDSIINLVTKKGLDAVVGNEVIDATANGGLIRSGAGTAQSPFTLGIAASGVTNTHIANNSVNSAKIADETITNFDISNSADITLNKLSAVNGTVGNTGASEGDVMSWGNGGWQPKTPQTSVTSVSGSNGITVTNGTTTPVVSLPQGTAGQVLTYNGTTWEPANTLTLTTITNLLTSTPAGGITANGYTDAYVWTNLQPGLYSLRLRLNFLTNAKFILQGDVTFGTSIPFEVTPQSHDFTAEVMFHLYYPGTLRLRALCTDGCPTHIFNLYLGKFN